MPYENDGSSIDTQDPYLEANRAIFNFNRKVDTVIIKPLALSYQAITPSLLNKCISHVFLNLTEINTIANDILQLRLKYALEDSWRFAINSSLGIGGCFEMASNFDLSRRTQTFNFTLRTWDINPGPFIIIPFIGASTAFDSIGIILKYYTFDPVRLLNNYRNTVQITRIIDKRSQLLSLDSAIENSFDPYIFYQNAYYQYLDKNYQLLINPDNNNEHSFS